VEQTLENKPTAYLGWDSFGDVILKRIAVTSGKAGDMSLERRGVPFLRSRIRGAERHD
jgi:hypothetical protein